MVAGPGGERYRYEKIHPFSYAGEDRHYRAGSTPLVVDVEDLRLAVFVCYDLRFADVFWELAPEVDGYVVVANWPAARRTLAGLLLAGPSRTRPSPRTGWAPLAPARPITPGIRHHRPMGSGSSRGSTEQTMLLAQVTSERVKSVRADFPS